MTTQIPYLPTHSKHPVTLDHLDFGEEYIRLLTGAVPLASIEGRESVSHLFWATDTRKFGKEPYIIYRVVRGLRGEKTGIGRRLAQIQEAVARQLRSRCGKRLGARG